MRWLETGRVVRVLAVFVVLADKVPPSIFVTPAQSVIG
jgi:hypothetical protein